MACAWTVRGTHSIECSDGELAGTLAQAPESGKGLLQSVSGACEAEPTIAEQLQQAELEGQLQEESSRAATAQLDYAQTTAEVESPADLPSQSPESLPGFQLEEGATARASIAACSDAVASQRQPESGLDPAQQGDSHLALQHSGAAQLRAGNASVSPVESDVMGFSPGISDKHCMSVLPQTKQKRKRMSERDWIAEQGEGMGGFGLQMMPTPAAAQDQRKSSSKKRPAFIESVKAQLQARKARKTEQCHTAAGRLASIEEQQEQPTPYHDCMPGSDGEDPSGAAALPEDSGEAWNGMIAEEHASQPSRTQTLQEDEAGGAREATCDSAPAPAKQGARAAKTMSPTYLQRRSARGVCPAEALTTPGRMPAGEAPDSRQTAQQPDAACTISLSANAQKGEIAEPAGKKQAKAAGQKKSAQEGSARAQLRQAGASLKAMRARGEHARVLSCVIDL